MRIRHCTLKINTLSRQQTVFERNFTNLPGVEEEELITDDLNFTNRLKILSLIPFAACTSMGSDSFGVSRDDGPSVSVTEELVSMATSPTALSNSGRISCLLKCKSRAISRFPLQAFRRFTATPKRENRMKRFL